MNQNINTNLLKCQKCFRDYNQQFLRPIILCPSQHTICEQCINSLRQPLSCLFCRVAINPSNFVINQQILYQISLKTVKPNYRIQAQNVYSTPPQNLPLQYAKTSKPQNAFFELGQSQKRNANSVQEVNYYQPIDQFEQRQSISNQHKNIVPIEDKGSQFMSHLCFFGLIFVFLILPTFFTIYFGLTDIKPKCSTIRPSQITSVQSFYLGFGITQMVLILLAIIIKCAQINHTIDFRDDRNKVGPSLGGILLAGFLFFWTVVQLVFFVQIVGPLCSGGLRTHSIIIAILNLLMLAANALFLLTVLPCFRTR